MTFLASPASSASRIFAWKTPCRSSNLCALGIGWCPSTFRMRTSRFLSIRFCIGQQTFQFRTFGLSSTPQVFTCVMASVSSIMHCFGYRILRYLDDWLVLRSSFYEITRARDFLLWLCQELGILVNLFKSALTLAQSLDSLGMTLQTSPLRAFPTQALIRKVLSLVEEFSSSQQHPLTTWHSLLVVMSSISALVPVSRLWMRSLQLRLNVAGPQASEDMLVSWDNS